MTDSVPHRRLWHGLVTFSCAITIPDDEEEITKELIKPALYTASLVNDLFSFEKEKGDKNVQNAVLVVMREHGCTEEKAREIIKDRIRFENARYVQVVKDTNKRTDVSDEVKRYIDTMQYTLSGNVAWSTQCPRYHMDATWNDLQLLRAKYGVSKYPATWPPSDPKDAIDSLNGHSIVGNGVNGHSTNGHHVNGSAVNGHSVNGHSVNGCNGHVSNGVNGHTNGHIESTNVNGYKRKRGMDDDEELGKPANGFKKSARGPQSSTDSLNLSDVVSLALVGNLPELSDEVGGLLAPTSLLASMSMMTQLTVVRSFYNHTTTSPLFRLKASVIRPLTR